TMTVRPRPTPAERANEEIPVEVEEALTVFAATMEDWTTPRQSWEFELREGTETGRVNNVEARLLFVQGEQTSSISFRLDQLDAWRTSARRRTRIRSCAWSTCARRSR